MSVFDKLRAPEERYSFNEYVALMADIANNPTSYEIVTSWPSGGTEEQGGTGYDGNAGRLRTNGPVYTLMAIRLRLFSQIRWAYQNLRSGRPGDLFDLPSLNAVNRSATLNAEMIRDVDLAGNFYGVIEQGTVRRLRPDWVNVISDRPLDDYDAEIRLFMYYEGGFGGDPMKGQPFLPSEVIHWAPEPDPSARWRGMSWLTPVIREAAADSKMTSFKTTMLDNGATPNMVIKFDKDISLENFEKFKEAFQTEHEGARNALKTLFLAGGADATVVGANLQTMDFTAVQGKGETRLANAAGIHPVVAGFSEGMQGSSLNAGNFGQARRSTADTLLHPLWVSAAGALGSVLIPPAGSRMWYDARDIPFLREDAKDDADIRATDAGAIRQLIDAGYKPDAVIDAITSGDLKRLTGNHTELFSVQLQPAGVQDANTPAARSLKLVRNADGLVETMEMTNESD